MGGRVKIALLLAPALLVIGVLFAGGLFAAVVQSLGYLPAIGQTEISLDAYREVLTGEDFVDSFLLTTYVAGASTGISTVLAVLAALALRRAGGRLSAIVFQLPITIPHLVAAVGIALVISQAGLGARLAAALGLIGDPGEFPALLYDGVAGELEEVARTLGANAWQRFWYVVFPVISPGIIAASLIVFAFTFGAFEVPYLLGRTYPTILPVMAYNEYRDIELTARPVAMAINVLIALITAVFAALYLRLARDLGRG